MNFKETKSILQFSIRNHDVAILLGEVAANIIDGRDLSSVLGKTDIKNVSLFFDLTTTRFKDNRHIEYFYSIYVIEQNINSKSFDLHKFLSIAKDRSSSQSEYITYDFYNHTLVNLDKVFDLDLSKYIVENKSILDRRTKHGYFEIFPLLKSNSAFIPEAISIAIDGIKVEDNFVTLYTSLQEFSINNPDVAEGFIDYFINEEVKLLLVAPFIFWGVTKARGLNITFSKLQTLLSSEKSFQILAGIRCLNMLNKDEFNLLPKENELLQLLNNVLTKENDELTREVVYCYGMHLKTLSNAKDEFFKLIDKPTSSFLKFTVSNVLCFHTIADVDLDLCRRILHRLVVFDSNVQGIFQYLYLAFSNIQKHNANLIYEYFEWYIKNEDNSPSDVAGFKRCFEMLANTDLSKLEYYLTKWFNEDHDRFHIALASISSVLWVAGIRTLRLSKMYLDEVTFYDVEFILIKIAGYIPSKDHLESLIFSSLKKKDVERQHVQMVVDLFAGYIWYNYPACVNFLEQQREEALPIENQAINAIVEYAENMNGQLKKKPKELAPSSERMQLFTQQKGKFYSREKFKDKFRENSIFDLAKHIDLKVGNSFFSRNTGEFGKNAYSTKSTMGKITRQMDFPAGEFIDPVGQAYLRYVWRIFKRRSL